MRLFNDKSRDQWSISFLILLKILKLKLDMNYIHLDSRCLHWTSGDTFEVWSTCSSWCLLQVNTFNFFHLTNPWLNIQIFVRFPRSSDENSFDDAYLSGEIVQILMKHEKYDDPRLCEHMISWGRVMGIGAYVFFKREYNANWQWLTYPGVLEKHMGILDAKFKTEMLKNIYAGVHRKNVKDSDLEAFFKFKCWIWI